MKNREMEYKSKMRKNMKDYSAKKIVPSMKHSKEALQKAHSHMKAHGG